jgi:hypothetical protein
MRIAAVLLVIFIIMVVQCGSSGCQRNGAAQKQEGVVSDAERGMVSRLTANRWRFMRGAGGLAEGYSYHFLPDGTFKWNVISDYPAVGDGLWNLRKLSEDEGLLFLLWQNGVPAGAANLGRNRYVLHFRFIDRKRLSLAGDVLEPVKLSTGDGVPKSTKLPDIIKATDFRDYFGMAARSWAKADATDNDFIPDSYTLKEDGTFIARYRNGSCQHGGRWSLTEHLLFEMEPNNCDVRGSRTILILGQSYQLEGDTLILNGKYRYRSN